jgi:hypothetical protein
MQPLSRRMILALLILIALSLGGLLLPAGAQGGPGEDLLRSLVQFLSRELNRPISIVDSYSYESQTFPDAALGCPQDGETYTPGPVPGWVFLLTIQGISYDVRANQAGSQFVLCTTSDIRQPAALATYRTREFSIPYPSTWRITERESDVYFGLARIPICDQPGMLVADLGPTTVRDADALLDAYTGTVRGAQFGPERASIRRIGRSAFYLAPCADGSPRLHRVTFFVAYGRAYRVLQFAPQDAFSQWADVYQRILDDFGPTTIGGSGGQVVTFPEVSPLAAIAHIFAGDVYVGSLADLPGVPITTGGTVFRAFRHATISPRGDAIAYVDPNERALYIAQLPHGYGVRRLVRELDPRYPLAWSPAGDSIAFVSFASDNAAEVRAISLDGNERAVGPIPGDAACPTAPQPADPAERLYMMEAGAPGLYPPLLIWGRGNLIYHSLACGIGVGIIPAAGGESEIFSTSLYRAQLSPDGAAFAGLIDMPGPDGTARPALAVVQLADRQAVILPTGETPDVVGWGSDGRALYYATAVREETFTLDDAADGERGLAVFGAWPFSADQYDVALRRIDLVTGVDAEVFGAAGRGIGRIVASPDGAGILFTFIQSSAALVEAFSNGVSTGELWRQTPVIDLYWLATGLESQAQRVAVSSAPAWGPLGSALAPTPTGSRRQPTVQPSPTPPATWTPFPAQAVPTSPFGAPPPTNTPRPSPTPDQ